MPKMNLKFLVLLIFISSTAIGHTTAQISNVSSNQKHLYIYSTEGRMISDFFCFGNIFGFSNSIVGTADSKHIYVYDERGRKISDFFVFGFPSHVIGDFIVSKDNKHVYVYDKSGRKVSDYFER
jgi:hypothetical protein